MRLLTSWARAVNARLSWWVGATALVAISAAGCGGGIGGYCTDAADCERGNDSDIEACQLRFDETQEIADLKNCNSEFDDYFACIEESARCNNDRYGVSDGQCGDEADRLQNCIK